MARSGRKTKLRRTHRKGTRRATRKGYGRLRGGYADLNPSSLSNSSMDAPYKLNMLQGQEYSAQHANQHGGYKTMDIMNTPPMSTPPMNAPSVNTPKMNAQMGGMGGMTPMNVPSMNIPSVNTPPMNTPSTNSTKMNAQMGGMAPVGDTGVLDSSLRDSARISPIDQAFQEIAGMKDQAGGRRRRKGRKGRKSRKGSRRGRGRKSRRNGCRSRRMRGGSLTLMPASTDASPMLLEGKSSSDALSEMNTEWKLAENPNAFNPLK